MEGNRVGAEGDMDFAGESLVVDADGDVIVKADDTEQIILADVRVGRFWTLRCLDHRVYIHNSFHEILIINALNEKRLLMVLYKISR